ELERARIPDLDVVLQRGLDALAKLVGETEIACPRARQAALAHPPPQAFRTNAQSARELSLCNRSAAPPRLMRSRGARVFKLGAAPQAERHVRKLVDRI